MGVPPAETLRGVGIVLATGFIGYFGRHMAMPIIEMMRRKEAEQMPMAVKESSRNQGDSDDYAQLNLEKKRAKAEVKGSKKQDKEAR